VLEKIRQLDTCKGVRVEMRLQGPSPEVHRPSPLFYSYVGYCIFFPEQEFKLSRDYPEGVCYQKMEDCGSHCNVSEDLIGEVGVSARRVCDYDLAYLRKEFAGRGLRHGDVVSEIGYYYPVRPTEVRGMGIGGSVLKEVVKDCKRLGSAAVYCETAEQVMQSMLRNRGFGFEELAGRPGEFIRVFKKEYPNDSVWQ
jgi:hypothetical protein